MISLGVWQNVRKHISEPVDVEVSIGQSFRVLGILPGLNIFLIEDNTDDCTSGDLIVNLCVELVYLGK